MKKTQSFTKQVKEELCSNVYESQDRLRALLAAYIRINGSLVFRDRKSLLTLKTENAKIAKFIYQTINATYDANAHLSFASTNKKNTTYVVTISDASEAIIEDLDISFLEGKISKNIVRNDDTIAGYLAGAFLASGSVNSPETSNYHLEISCNSENFAKWLSKLFARYKNSNIEPKITHRREKYVVYFKKSDQIANFLIMVGAVDSCMEFENVRVDRDFMNNTNRLTNIDTANMKKVYETAARQVEEIKFIDEHLGIDHIVNEKQRLVCRIRLENEAASLVDIADILSEKLDKTVTKSNVNHIFRAIHALWEKLSA